MASIDAFPVPAVAEFIAKIVDRSRMRDGSIAGHMEMHLMIDEARMVWAAAKHLDFYYDWHVGVEQTRFKLKECRDFLDEKKQEAKNDLMLRLDRRGIRIVMDSLIHLDRLAIALEGDGKKSRKKGRRN